MAEWSALLKIYVSHSVRTLLARSLVKALLMVPLVCVPASAGTANYCTPGKVITISDVQNMINMFLGIIPNSGCGSSTATTYSHSDLTGTWHSFQFVADSSTSYWAKATLTFNSSALATITNGSNSQGQTGQTGTWQFAISSDGIITDQTDASTKLVMSSDKQLIVGTGGSPDDKSLYIMVKSGSGFNQNNLQGTWKWHSLMQQGTSGNAHNIRWERGDVSVDSLGAAVMTNRLRSAGSIIETRNDSTFNLTLNPQGIVTGPGNASFYGVLSSDKSLMISVNTNTDGSVSLGLFTKTGGTAFSSADLPGPWRTNYLAVKNFYWGRALTTFNTAGLATLAQITQSNGSRSDVQVNFALASNGVLASGDWGAEGGVQTFVGIMAPNKNILFGTLTQDRIDQPHPTLVIWLK